MKTFALIFLLSFSQILFAQNKNRVAISYGLTGNAFISALDGSPSYNGDGSNLFEITFLRRLNKRITLKSGFIYSQNKFNISPAPTGCLYMSPYDNSIKMLSIPIDINFTFGKYFFIGAGLITDFELDRDEFESTDNQSGFGFGLGLGLQYTYKQIGIYTNPFINIHSIIPFYKENYQQHLVEAGVKFGVFYIF